MDLDCLIYQLCLHHMDFHMYYLLHLRKSLINIMYNQYYQIQVFYIIYNQVLMYCTKHTYLMLDPICQHIHQGMILYTFHHAIHKYLYNLYINYLNFHIFCNFHFYSIQQHHQNNIYQIHISYKQLHLNILNNLVEYILNINNYLDWSHLHNSLLDNFHHIQNHHLSQHIYIGQMHKVYNEIQLCQNMLHKLHHNLRKFIIGRCRSRLSSYP